MCRQRMLWFGHVPGETSYVLVLLKVIPSSCLLEIIIYGIVEGVDQLTIQNELEN